MYCVRCGCRFPSWSLGMNERVNYQYEYLSCIYILPLFPWSLFGLSGTVRIPPCVMNERHGGSLHGVLRRGSRHGSLHGSRHGSRHGLLPSYSWQNSAVSLRSSSPNGRVSRDQPGRAHLACIRGVAADVPCNCLLYTSPSPRDLSTSRMPSSA